MYLLQKFKQYIPITSIFVVTIFLGILTVNLNRILPGKTAPISGVFSINGVIPQGSTLTLFVRDIKEGTAFKPVINNIPTHDLASWQFKTGITGNSYELKAGIVLDSNVKFYTNTITVKAPALNEVLIFNIPSSNPFGKASIKGIITIIGYIPANATISVNIKKSDAQNFEEAIKNLPSTSNQVSFDYEDAVAGQTYDIQAVLYDTNKKLLGQSVAAAIVAPAANANISLNSNASPQLATPQSSTSSATQKLNLTPTNSASLSGTPTSASNSATASISGTITFTGQAPLNSRIVIFQRITGTSTYNVASDNITPVNGAIWYWSNSISGSTYDLIAILKQKQNSGSDLDVATSTQITLASPSINGNFTVASGVTLTAPVATISITCNTYNGSTLTWPASISFSTISGAQSYWYEIGTTDGGTDLANFTMNATNGSNQIITEPLKNGTTYYARYAYAAIPNLLGGNSQFSPLSSTVQMKCSQ